MIWNCGTDRDYNGWAETTSDQGWNYENILPYIKRSENNTDPDIVGNGAYHGTTGNLTISTNVDDIFVRVFEDGFNELGYKTVKDYNSEQYNGFVRTQATIRDSERMSSYRAFIEPVKNNSNLYIMKRSLAIKIGFTGNKATSVTVQTPWAPCSTITLTPTKEVIVSAGGLGSPKLLLQSGIGKSADLKPFGIKQVKSLPVGDNLMDHVYAVHFIKMNPNAGNLTLGDFLYVDQVYYYKRVGPLNQLDMAHGQGIINTTSPTATYPDIQFIPFRVPKMQELTRELLANLKDEFIDHLVRINANYEFFMVFTVVLNPFSRGSIKLHSSNPNDEPIIRSGYFEDPRDVETMIRGINKMKTLVETKSFQSLNASLVKIPIPECDPLPYPSDEYEKCYIKYFSASLWHPSGTCKMGKTSAATTVVDSQLKVRGFKNLRVADASVMPVITTGNTQCPTYAIGQKAADLIKASWL